MRITSIQIQVYSFPFQQPVQLFTSVLTQREVFILLLKTEDGQIGIGEISPLPEFHPWSSEELLREMKAKFPLFLNRSFPTKPDLLNLAKLFPVSLSPILHFGMEMALSTLVWQISSQSLLPTNASVFLNALIHPLHSSATEKIQQKFRDGWRVFKIKVGRKDPETELRELENIFRTIPGDAIFRLDANRRWNIKTAIAFCSSLPSEKIEYMEEPLDHIHDYARFFQETVLPVALDESFDPASVSEMVRIPGLKAVVIKPEFFGSIFQLVSTIKKIQQFGIYPVFSSSFYSPFGTAYMAFLAQMLAPSSVAHGFDTLSYFDLSLFPWLHINQSSLKIPDLSRLHEYLFSLKEYKKDEIKI